MHLIGLGFTLLFVVKVVVLLFVVNVVVLLSVVKVVVFVLIVVELSAGSVGTGRADSVEFNGGFGASSVIVEFVPVIGAFSAGNVVFLTLP